MYRMTNENKKNKKQEILNLIKKYLLECNILNSTE